MPGTELHLWCVCCVLVVQASARRPNQKSLFTDKFRSSMEALQESNARFARELAAQESQLEAQLLAHPVSQELKRLGVPLQFAALDAAMHTPRRRQGGYQKSRWVQHLAVHRELVLKSQLLELRGAGNQAQVAADPDPETSSQLLGALADVEDSEATPLATNSAESVQQPTVPFLEYLILKDKAESNGGKVAELQQQVSELRVQLAAARAAAAAAAPAVAPAVVPQAAVGDSDGQFRRRERVRRRSSSSSSDEHGRRGRQRRHLRSGIEVVMVSDT
jgi:phage shock protein A